MQDRMVVAMDGDTNSGPSIGFAILIGCWVSIFCFCICFGLNRAVASGLDFGI